MSTSTYATTANGNDGLGIADENQAPSTVNNGVRQIMADIRNDLVEGGEYKDWGHTPTYTSATTFTVTGDQTSVYVVDRAIECTDATTLYGFITAVAYTTLTTVTVALTSGSLSASLTAVAVGLNPTNSGLPYDTIGQIKNKFTASGTNTYTGTLSNVTAYTEGLEVIMVPTNYNTDDDCTLNLNSLGATTIYIADDSGQWYKLHSGAMRANVAYKLIYTDSSWLLVNPNVESASEAYDGTSTFAISQLATAGSAWSVTTHSTNSLVYTKLVEATITKDHIQFSGSLYIDFTMLIENAAATAYCQVYRNGGAVGTEQTTTDTNGVAKTETITGWSVGDTIEIWGKTSNATYAAGIGNTGAFQADYDVTAKGFKTKVTLVTTP